MSSAAPKNSDDKPKPTEGQPEKSAALILFAIAADTTWRMFVPTLGGTLIGLWLDSLNKTEPLYGVIGLGIGIIITTFLVRQQYKQSDEQK
jgi:F0F1-type ATP synthase assembly protein I